MGVYKQRNSNNWWYKFAWRGETIRKSTKQTNKRVAEQMEAARKTQLAKGELGIEDRKASPTLRTFLEKRFLPFYEITKREAPNTLNFYRFRITKLLKDSALSGKPLEQITSDDILSYISRRRKNTPYVSVATINRELATLKRAFKLAGDWNEMSTRGPAIEILDGEQGREHVLSFSEEVAYLNAAAPLLKAFATIILDCGLRPDEVYRLRWDHNYRGGRLIVHTGKTKAARRSIPVTQRLVALLEIQKGLATGAWIFPAPTKTGHIDESSVKKQHKRAIKES